MSEFSSDIIKSDDHLVNYVLQLADNSLIMGHRLSEWTGHGPMLEQDIAISNIALDLIGQSRNFYQYAAELIIATSDQTVSTEDTLAYLRDAEDFKNILLVELPNGDWAMTILKIFFFSTYQYFFYQKLIYSSDKQLSAIAEKSLKEVTYHLRWSSEWVIRLGDGTAQSKNRIQTALDELLSYTDEMFTLTNYENECLHEGTGVDVGLLKDEWNDKVENVLQEATLSFPKHKQLLHSGGKQGMHTEHLVGILNEMQYLQRTYPGCEW